MEEIKVGEYVRTNKGRIQKIKYFSDFVKKIDENGNILDYEYVFHTGYPLFHIEIEKIVKHSLEIIDLIEEGDYVNRERILDITGDYIHTNETVHNKFYLAKHIKSIVTKEMMKLVEYRVV